MFIEEGVVHYCVGNMPGAVPYTSTVALSNATFKYAAIMADLGLEEALKLNPGLANGLNIYLGKCTNKNVAAAHDIDYTPVNEAIA